MPTIDVTDTLSDTAIVAIEWLQFGLKVVPILPQTLQPALPLEPWLAGLSADTITQHWLHNPSHELACIACDRLLVVVTDGDESEKGLSVIEQQYGAAPMLIIKSHGSHHHYFRVVQDTSLTIETPSPACPYPIGLKIHGDLIVLPPSTDTEVLSSYAPSLDQLMQVDQAFIDALLNHNRALPKALDAVDTHPVTVVVGTQNGDLEPCEYEVISPSPAPVQRSESHRDSPLAAFSLRGQLAKLEAQTAEQIPILGKLVLLSQVVLFYAPPNTGKTLFILHMIIQSIKQGIIDPSRLFYINMDDTGSGVVDKLQLAEEYGFETLVDGHNGFEAGKLRVALEEMIADGTARDAIVIVDTLKKFVNLMDKSKSSDFTKLIRRFSLKGGTFIGLAHANKHPGADGRAMYSGTSDFVDDVDCVYMLNTIPQSDPTQKVVEFSNIKRRGNVAQTAAYSYTLDRDIPYNELLLSVQEVNPNQLTSVKRATEVQTDAQIIESIAGCIRDGIDSKMKLAEAAAQRAGCSKRSALKVVDKYTGNDPAIHQWSFTVKERGAKVFMLLAPPCGSTDEPPPVVT
ncbi:bifunctional DNA primase/polymerase [Pseudomonas sp. UMAB-08]|uniref:bifunctional DNA primase/polymerase n=1 Tax=Pseudomonas sp. UMAB-08 TaxID=1365375 RepID=UPI001C572A08|nr:AAA family ATPase [Pseudomonas sp. UMAB-08]